LWNRQTCLWFWIVGRRATKPQAGLPIPQACSLRMAVQGHRICQDCVFCTVVEATASSWCAWDCATRCDRDTGNHARLGTYTVGANGCGIDRLACELVFSADVHEMHRQVCLFHRRARLVWPRSASEIARIGICFRKMTARLAIPRSRCRGHARARYSAFCFSSRSACSQSSTSRPCSPPRSM